MVYATTTRKEKSFLGNKYYIMVQHKDSDFIPFFVSDKNGGVTADTLKAVTFNQGIEVTNIVAKFHNGGYIITKILK